MKICMTAFVFGDYKRYIPFFCYSVVKSYPEYAVRIFVDGELGNAEKSCIDDIRKYISSAVHIEENAFEGIKLPQTPKIRCGQKMYLRWLFEKSDFVGFDCVYFSDIDFLVLRQEPTLGEFHVRNAERFGLPFSNMVRADKTKTGKPPDRLSGCHFVLSEPYFTRMDPVVREFKHNPALITDAAPNATSNEHFLYALVQRAIPFDGNALRESLRPVPGAHLGRARGRWDLSEIVHQMKNYGPDGNPAFPDLHGQLRAFCDDPVFRRILWRVNVPEVAIFLAQMGVLPSGLWQRLRITSLMAEAGLDRWTRRIKSRLGLVGAG